MLILETLFGIAAERSITSLGRKLLPEQGDERAQQIHEALERAYKRFHENHPAFGKHTDSFLARKENFDRILASLSYQSEPLRGADLDGEGYDAPPAPEDIREAFVAILHEEMRTVDVLERLLHEQAKGARMRRVEDRLEAVVRELTDPRQVREAHYLQRLIKRFDPLDFSPFDDPTAPRQGEVKLSEVFTALLLAEQCVPGQDLAQAIRGEHAERHLTDEAKPVPIPAAEAIAAVPRLVVLGGPGSGKSALVRHLCVTCARQRLLAMSPPSSGRRSSGSPPGTDDLQGGITWAAWGTRERPPLPLLIILRELAATLPANATKGTAQMVTAYLRTHCDDAYDAVWDAWLREGGLVCFDGLDEVPESDLLAKRSLLIEAITDFANTLDDDRYRVVITCRTYAYEEDDAWHLPKDLFPKVHLAPFKEAQWKAFTTDWYRAEGRRKGWAETRQTREADTLLQAIKARSHLQELAASPLLLSLMAFVHGGIGSLPENRADLYGRAVKLLLVNWDNVVVRELEGSRTVVPEIVMRLDLQEGRLRGPLQKVAYTVHQRQAGEADRRLAAANIPEAVLLDALREEFDSPAEAEDVLDYIRDRAGLVLYLGNHVFQFPHKTFQEYLAAQYLLDQSDFYAQLCEHLAEDRTWWREVFLLAAGASTSPRDVADLIDDLVPEAVTPGVLATAGIEDILEDVRLAAQALWESDFQDRVAEEQKRGRSRRFQDIYERIQGWLAAAMTADEALKPPVRAQAGTALGQLGDPRAGMAPLRKRKSQRHGSSTPRPPVLGIEAMPFCYVPLGPFMMGSPETDEMATWDDEKTLHQVPVPYGYWMSRYPVTQAQYAAFVKAGGYKPEAADRGWWTEAGWAWRVKEKIAGPRAFSHPYEVANHPVVGVSWYEAYAFTRWLTEQWAKLLGDEWKVRLPSEAEWEKAARGGLKIPSRIIDTTPGQGFGKPEVALEPNPASERRYPWEDPAPDPNRANYGDTGIGTTSAVGCFPGGRSPYGLEEVSGNVWEWTQSLWHEHYPYPETPQDRHGREVSEGTERRVLRGGSFHHDVSRVRCASRDRNLPSGRNLNFGFRVLLLPSADPWTAER